MQDFGFDRDYEDRDNLSHGPVLSGERIIDYDRQDDNLDPMLSGPGKDGPDFSPEDIKKKRIKIVIFGGAVLFVVMILFGIYTFKDVFGSSKPKKQNTAAVLQVSEEEYQKLLMEREELIKRLDILEQEKDQINMKISEEINNRLSELMQGREPVSIDQTEVLSQLQELRSQLDQMKQAGGEVRQKPAPPEPKRGSSASTQVLNQVSAWKEAQANLVKSVEDEARKRQEGNYSRVPGIQAGTMIDGTLQTRLISAQTKINTDQFYAVISTARPIPVHGSSAGGKDIELPAGVKFLGRVISDFDSRRIFVEVKTMQYKDVSIPVSGVVLDGETSNPGLLSKYIDPINQAAWGLLIPNLLSAAAEAGQEMETVRTSDGYIYDRPKYTAENMVRQGLANTMSSVAGMLTEAYLKKKPVMLVNAGIPVKIQITQTIPLDVLLESGMTAE